MKITLRKAKAIQDFINEGIKGLRLEIHVMINEYQDASKRINDAQEKFMSESKKRENFLSSLYEIREKVGVANTTSGIDQFLGKVAHIEKNISFLENICSKEKMIDMSEIVGKLNKIRTRKDDVISYGRENEVTVSILGEDFINLQKKNLSQLKKEKQKIQDTILELNVKTEIELSDFTESFLKEEGII